MKIIVSDRGPRPFRRRVSPAFPLSIISTLIISVLLSPAARSEEYYFDPGLLKGTSLGLDMERFNRKEVPVPDGDYTLDVYVNNTLVSASERISFRTLNGGKSEPCLSAALVDRTAIKVISNNDALSSGGCLPVSRTGQKIDYTTDMSGLRLDLTVPQSALLHNPRGYIPVEAWDAGALALFLRHNTSFTRTDNTGSHYSYNYLWSNINTGTNLGLWQVRHTGNLRYADSNLTGSSYRYNAVRTWVQRPLPALESVIAAGDNYTSNSLFGSLSFNGVKLSTDQQMWPQGKRGYAPEVRGIAGTTARVVVRQQGRVIYETTVSPGSFVISDLYNTKDQGDLQVEVIEAGGKVSTFTVPYTSVPDSVRPGNWNYSLSLGRVRHYYSVNNNFMEGILQRGVNNALTVSSGLRIADAYQAALFGGVVATPAGAFGLNTTFSHADVENDRSESGWRADVSYSRTFDTGTNLVLAAYRYSTTTFHDLQDVLGIRRQEKTGTAFWSDTLRQRNRFSATVSQPMDAWGVLNLSASTTDYYGSRGRVNQLQLGYSNSWHQVSYNLSIARQQTVQTDSRYYYSVRDDDYDTSNRRKYTENTISLSFSVPLDFGKSRSDLTVSMNKGQDGRDALVGLSGSAGEQSNFSYSVYAGAEDYRSGGNTASWGGSVQQNTSVGAFRANTSAGKNYRQYGAGYSGTMVVHPGGITAGPYASDTFALIHAPGARGAMVNNGQGATIDRFGYAIIPSLAPYRYNNISLDSRYTGEDVELQGGSIQVVPYAGAMPEVTFETLRGRSVLINTTGLQGEILPMGADVLDRDAHSIGMVGQAGQIYARIPDASGVLTVTWGKRPEQSCRIDYQLPEAKAQTVTQLTLPCARR